MQHLDFDEILQVKAYCEEYLKEKCWLEHYQPLSFRYFVKLLLIPKLVSKNIIDPEDIFKGNSALTVKYGGMHIKTG